MTTARPARSPGGSDEITLEPYHDRIREAVGGQLSADDVAAWHRRLAEAWEIGPRAPRHARDPLCRRLGRHARSLDAEKAADLAEHALAFGRAAESYRPPLRLNAQPAKRR